MAVVVLVVVAAAIADSASSSKDNHVLYLTCESFCKGTNLFFFLSYQQYQALCESYRTTHNTTFSNSIQYLACLSLFNIVCLLIMPSIGFQKSFQLASSRPAWQWS